MALIRGPRPLIPLALALFVFSGASFARGQETPAPPPTPRTPTETPLPPTTTMEKMVNPTGLSELPGYGWHTDFIGAGRGRLRSVVWREVLARPLLSAKSAVERQVELLPGIRARLAFRRREGEKEAFQIDSDELYLEAFNQYRARSFDMGANIRVGHVRYLHFPYPDAIAEFDQVPGIADLYGQGETDYRSIVAQGEFALHSGLGVHATGRVSGLDEKATGRLIEAYGFYRQDFRGGWRVEGRLGEIAVRHEPLGRNGQTGGDLYVGKQIGEFNVGLLYENKHSEHEYAGIVVRFRSTPTTRVIGRYMLDYSRTPEGFTAQIPLLHVRLNESRLIPNGSTLVGEVRAVRIRTLWQQGFVRNQYEHRLESWGETGDPRLRCVVLEEPWYLQAEALVSPHLTPDARWERDRQGPGQYVQRVTYRYYRLRPRPQTGT